MAKPPPPQQQNNSLSFSHQARSIFSQMGTMAKFPFCVWHWGLLLEQICIFLHKDFRNTLFASLSISVCGGSLEKDQAQALSLTPISTIEKTNSRVVVVVVHAHTLSSKQECVELRKLAAPFNNHSLLDFLGALLLSNSPQSVRPKVRGDEEEEEENLTRTRISTHNAQEEEITVVRIINREEINQIDSSVVNCKSSRNSTKIKHVIIVTDSNPATKDLKPENKRSDQPSKTHKHRHTSLSKR
jgi:hypothetical protein